MLSAVNIALIPRAKVQSEVPFYSLTQALLPSRLVGTPPFQE